MTRCSLNLVLMVSTNLLSFQCEALFLSLYFFDDILVYSSNLLSHQKHLSLVLQILLDNHLSAKWSKYSFGVQSVKYFGHIISVTWVFIDPQKVGFYAKLAYSHYY
jgi:hypothetical protein